MHGKSFMERFRSKPENAAKAAATKAKAKPKSLIERSEDYYVKLHRTQITKLWELRSDPAACTLFVVLLLGKAALGMASRSSCRLPNCIRFQAWETQRVFARSCASWSRKACSRSKSAPRDRCWFRCHWPSN